MNGIFVFVASNAKAAANLELSISKPINRETVYKVFKPIDSARLAKVEKAAPGFYAWGATSKPRHARTWMAMAEDDYVLCVKNGVYRYAARMLEKFENERFASSVWGQGVDRASWPLMYFLTQPVPTNVPVDEMDRYYMYRGFMGFKEVSTSKIVKAGESIERFMQRRFGI